MRRLLALTVAVLAVAAVPAQAFRWNVSRPNVSREWRLPAPPPQLKPLMLHVAAGRSVRACTRNVPASAPPMAVFVTANGHDVPVSFNGRRDSYYAGSGTMVEVISEPGDGPFCVRAMTWLPTVTVRVRFRAIT